MWNRATWRRSGSTDDAGLDEVLDRRRLRSVFQPIIDLRDNHVAGVEALARIPGDSHESPSGWFDRARAAGRTAELDLLAAETALAARRSLPDDVYLAVNISPSALLDERIIELLERAAGDVVVEITEHEIVEDYDTLAVAVHRYREHGIRFAIDDAGAGWNTLRHVLELGPEILKLDQTLISRVTSDRTSRALVAALAGFSREVGTTMIAEGVETAEQLAVLAELGVDHGQGFGLGRPGSLCAAIAPPAPVGS